MDKSMKVAINDNEFIIKSILKSWSDVAKVGFSYKRESLPGNKWKFIIYSKRPGVLIGTKGELVNRVKMYLAYNLYIDVESLEIQFIEVDGTIRE